MHSNEVGNWYAIRVRSGCEKAAAADLSARDYEGCGAVAPQRRVWADRGRTVEMPLSLVIFSPVSTLRETERMSSARQVSPAWRVLEIAPCPWTNVKLRLFRPFFAERRSSQIAISPRRYIRPSSVGFSGRCGGNSGKAEERTSARGFSYAIATVGRRRDRRSVR
jgi:hypothetical protein